MVHLHIKLVVGFLFLLAFIAHAHGWGRIRVRIPVVRRVVRVVRKAGNGIKNTAEKAGKGLKKAGEETGKGLKKAGEETGKGLKKAGEETGKGLKKAGEETGKGLKKAGEVTGKGLLVGLKASGKAFIEASNFVGDILNRINLMKFIWKKLGACCIPIPSLCRAKKEFNSVQKSLNNHNTNIDKKWTQVETLFAWLGRNNENVEDLTYHVDRITSPNGDETMVSINPQTMIDYNNQMNTIKQDVKWKNSSVIHLTRQGVTSFVEIEMAWQCPKVANSVKSGLRELKKADQKCVDITRESNNLLRFMDKGWRHIKQQLTSSKLKTRLEQIKELCEDSGHTFCVKSIENFLRNIAGANYGKTFELQEDIITALAATKYTYSCLKRKQKVMETVTETCKQGNTNFHAVFQQAIIDFFPNSDICTGLVTKDYTTKEDVMKHVQVEAGKQGFYSSCGLNNREVKTKTCVNYDAAVKTLQLTAIEESRLLEECKQIVPSLGVMNCHPGVCHNGGTCLEKKNSFSCKCQSGFQGTHCQTKTEIGVPYVSIGCFWDRHERAMPVLEGKYPSIMDNYKTRTNAIEKCYEIAKEKGFQVFAIQDGGHCGGGFSAEMTFDKYGVSHACNHDGKGGVWANQVYYIKDFINLGCYQDHGARAIEPLEGKDVILDGHYRNRENALGKCAVAAKRAGYTMFALQHGGWCASDSGAQDGYNKYGRSNACKEDGKGGPWANQVYLLKSPTSVYKTIGCYQDHGSRAISPKDHLLPGHYKSRSNAIERCYEVAKNHGFKVFSVQDGGWCATSDNALYTFNKYGSSSHCKKDGKGGPWANQVYYITDYTTVGCYRDKGSRAITSMENKDTILNGHYRYRKDAIAKCAAVARKAGFRMFAVQHGGWCAASETATNTYAKYGRSSHCKPDGKGGPWANQVYVFH